MSISEKDKKYLWHPYTHVKSTSDNIVIERGEEVFLYDEKGNRYIDAISSWWVNIHGHSHPYIADKVYEQFKTIEHVMFAGFTHKPAVNLAERLLKYLPDNQHKVFYSDNGSTAVEVALKMAIQYWANRGEKRKKIIAFKNAFHGDTFGAMAVSERGIFTLPFQSMLFEVLFVSPPEIDNEDSSYSEFAEIIKTQGNNIAAFIFEPLVQGAAGMRMHHAETLDKMIALCKQHNIPAIADEVMTGFGRTGRFFASDYLGSKPDIFCLSKGLTGGVMPLGITSCTTEIFSAFYDEDKTKTFFHGHSFTANPLACAAALASLDIFENENVFEKINHISSLHSKFAFELKNMSGIRGVRHLGTIIAIDMITDQGGYLDSLRDKMYNYFLRKGILLRPLGNTLYIMPPYCIQETELVYIYETIKEFIAETQ